MTHLLGRCPRARTVQTHVPRRSNTHATPLRQTWHAAQAYSTRNTAQIHVPLTV
jgi:hypothetical protein